MPRNTCFTLSTAVTLTLALSACDAPEPVDAPAPVDALEDRTALVCDPDLEASVGGIYYPVGWTCPQAIADAEASFGSYHYRNACHQQVGSDIGEDVDDAVVTSCQLDPSGMILVTVDLCCAEPPASCDPAHQATRGGIYYPGWTCTDAIANAEASLGSYHYRSACHQQTGSNLATPVQEATVTECHIESGSAVVTVDLCCS